MRKLSLGFALLFLLQLGVSAPQNSVDPKPSSSASKGSKVQKTLTSVATPQAFGDQIAKFFGRKSGNELMAEKKSKGQKAGPVSSQGDEGTTEVFQLPPRPVALGVPSAIKTSKSAVPSKAFQLSPKPVSLNASIAPKISTIQKLAVPPPPQITPSVVKIRQEIQQIFELNKMIKSVQGGRSVQLQRVQEQARIHQKILNELESSQEKKAENISGIPTKEDLLAQEKLRIIHEETQRNAQMIATLKENSEKTASASSAKKKNTAS